MTQVRIESDSMGEIEVPKDALYAAQTQRAANNFKILQEPMPPEFLVALAMIKQAEAQVNKELGLLDAKKADAISAAAEQVIAGGHLKEFVVEVYQTGSGTSTNMNMNEVLATLASRASGEKVNPNDDVNLGQSSNDVIPSALHLFADLGLNNKLLPAIEVLLKSLSAKAEKLKDITKTGRTHLMDAMPITFKQELMGWYQQISKAKLRLQADLPELGELALGGTAVGTGINAHPEASAKVCDRLTRVTGLTIKPSSDYFYSLSNLDTIVAHASSMKRLAVALMKIANDLRWMNSGPLAGLGEIELQALQPGSSIMPGKVNPVIPEAVCMVAAQVIGLETAITVAGQSGNFQLNVMLPLAINNIAEMQKILSGALLHLAQAIDNFNVREDNIEKALATNPILVTALNPVIGYQAAAKIAKTAYSEGRAVLDVAEEMTDLSRDELKKLLDPQKLTLGGIN